MSLKSFRFLVILLLGIGVALLGYHTLSKKAPTENATSKQKTAFDRIVRTNTLRCGYAVATPWFMVDPNTKQLSGVDYDLTNELAAKIGLKVDWVEETGWGVAEQGLITHRYDMLCGSVCIDPKRAKAATFSAPFLHIPLLAIVRDDDHRFDEGLKNIDTKETRIGVKNGHVFEYVANERFPQAQKIYGSDLSDDTEFFEMLKANKIDIAFSGQDTIDRYNEKSDFKIRALPDPARMCNGAFMMPLGDDRLKYMVDNAIGELNSDGRIEDILRRFMKFDPRYVHVPPLPYR